MPCRRSVLAGVGSLGATSLLAGCLWDVTNDSSITLRMVPVSRDDLGQARLLSVDDQGPWVREIVRRGLPDGTTVYGRKPLDESEFVAADGTYYGIAITENGTETVARPVLEASEAQTPEGSVGDWGNLSQTDVRTLRCAVSKGDRSDGPACIVYGDDASSFWPELPFRYLESGGDTYYRLRVSERPVTVARYEYTFEPVAENRSAFADYVASERIDIDFSSVDLTAEQRDILRTAAAEGSYEESPPPYSAALENLVGRLDSVRQRTGTHEAYVHFDGDYYRMDYQQAIDD